MTTEIPQFNPPVGALVRHTTRYVDGTVLTVEGRVAVAVVPPQNIMYVGGKRVVVLLARGDGVESVALDVLELPVAEPPDATFFGNGIDAIVRCDDPDGDDAEGRWWTTGQEDFRRWREVASVVTGRGWRCYVPDPADDAPALPWRALTNDSRYPDLVVDRADDAGDVLVVNGFRLAANQIRQLMGICARHLKPGAERDALQAAAREVEQP